jgi:hypothetical protein
MNLLPEDLRNQRLLAFMKQAERDPSIIVETAQLGRLTIASQTHTRLGKCQSYTTSSQKDDAAPLFITVTQCDSVVTLANEDYSAVRMPGGELATLPAPFLFDKIIQYGPDQFLAEGRSSSPDKAAIDNIWMLRRNGEIAWRLDTSIATRYRKRGLFVVLSKQSGGPLQLQLAYAGEESFSVDIKTGKLTMPCRPLARLVYLERLANKARTYLYHNKPPSYDLSAIHLLGLKLKMGENLYQGNMPIIGIEQTPTRISKLTPGNRISGYIGLATYDLATGHHMFDAMFHFDSVVRLAGDDRTRLIMPDGTIASLPFTIRYLLQYDYDRFLAVSVEPAEDNIWLLNRKGEVVWQMDRRSAPFINTPWVADLVSITKDGKVCSLYERSKPLHIDIATGKILGKIKYEQGKYEQFPSVTETRQIYMLKS